MDTLLQDIRFGLRLLIKSPTFTLVVTLTLALGIGASTAIFSIIHALWLQQLRFPGEERLVMVWDSLPGTGSDRIETSLANLADWKQHGEVFQRLAGMLPRRFNLEGTETAEHLQAFRVGAQLFPALGVGLGVVRQSKMFAAIDNTVTLPGFTRADAALFVRLGRLGGAQVNVENLLDERYYATSHGNNNIMPGASRSVRVSLTTRRLGKCVSA